MSEWIEKWMDDATNASLFPLLHTHTAHVYTHARAGSRSAADNLTIVANRLLAVALAMTRCGDIVELSTYVEKK